MSVLRCAWLGNARHEDNFHGSHLRLAMHQLFSRMVGGAINKSIDATTRANRSSPIELRNSRCRERKLSLIEDFASAAFTVGRIPRGSCSCNRLQ
jgi:hypothetical protein